MNLENLKNIWEKQEEVANASIDINQPLLFSIEANQQMEKMKKLKVARIVESIVFFMIIVSLWQYIVSDFTFSALTISAMILNVFAIVGFAGNIGQIVLISQFDFSAPVKDLQKNMYSICSHQLQVTRLVLLSVPFYMSYTLLGFDVIFSVDLYQYLSEQMVMLYAISTAILFIITVWLLSKLTYKNITTPWVKWTMGYIVGEQLIGMAEFINNAETA
jgi:hypothetical protein